MCFVLDERMPFSVSRTSTSKVHFFGGRNVLMPESTSMGQSRSQPLDLNAPNESIRIGGEVWLRGACAALAARQRRLRDMK